MPGALEKSFALLFAAVDGALHEQAQVFAEYGESVACFCVAGIKLTFRVKQPGIVRAINCARGRGQKVGNRVLAQRGAVWR